jgi:hypothetical protein
MNRQQQVFVRLKLKAKALGFNAKELKGIAAKIADNLKSAEDASEEDVNAEIDEQIEAVLPYLTFGQSQANRLLDEWKKKHPEAELDDELDDNIPDDTPKPASNKKNSKNKGNEQDEEPAWFKSFREQQEARFAALEGEKVSNLRKAKLEALLKDTGTFGSRTLKSFSKMSFESDDDFEEFYSDVEEDLKNYNQERADAGLATLSSPPAAGSKGSGKQDEVLTDKEVEDLVNTF